MGGGRLKVLVRKAVSLPILIYQRLISPLTPGSCIYRPTCSQYSVEAVMRHGAAKGLLIALLRLSRCVGGLFVGGDDPVPESFALRLLFGRYRVFRRGLRRG